MEFMSSSIPGLTILQAARGSTKISCTNADGPGKLSLGMPGARH